MSIEFIDLEVAGYETAEQATVDWTVLDEPGFMKAAESAARRVVRQYGAFLDFEDAKQEAYLSLATHSKQMRRTAAERGIDGVHHAVWCDVTNEAAKIMRRQQHNGPIDESANDGVANDDVGATPAKFGASRFWGMQLPNEEVSRSGYTVTLEEFRAAEAAK